MEKTPRVLKQRCSSSGESKLAHRLMRCLDFVALFSGALSSSKLREPLNVANHVIAESHDSGDALETGFLSSKLPHQRIPEATSSHCPPPTFTNFPLAELHRARFAARGDATLAQNVPRVRQSIPVVERVNKPHHTECLKEETKVVRTKDKVL
ncbi:unnamed protein product [Notodromas monacha]|uniref:Uncharacterized protein n=1 Tax=Notodromas monacha TaxID=399045 RepID=A0A7R9BV64_9CRUS|nr:unnamed protein product [Notodromas monacha]CAG0920816.1 unnamed protein product [Notodromas monacha]